MEITRACPRLTEDLCDQRYLFDWDILCVIQRLFDKLLNLLCKLLWQVADLRIGEKQVTQLVGREIRQHGFEPWLEDLQKHFRPSLREHESLRDLSETLIAESSNVHHDGLLHRGYELLAAEA